MNIYDELYKNADRIHHVIAAHEQGAAHAADGYARSTGKVGVVIATSGPGATNLVTGIANAYLDSVPMVAITGNVSCSLLGRDSFQEVDIVGVTYPITKHSYMVKDVTKLADTVREAFAIARSGRPGPVLIDLPKDVQINSTAFTPKSPAAPAPSPVLREEDLDQIAEMIKTAERPYIYCGGGVIIAEAGELVAKLADTIDAPIGFSMMGLSAVPAAHPRSLGMVGMHGHYASTKAKSECDLLLALGVRFSDRATGDKSKYASKARIIHIDVDSAEIDKNIPATLGVNANVREALEALLPRLTVQKHAKWEQEIEDMRRYEREHTAGGIGTLTPYRVIDAINAHADADTPIATDVGQHQMWVAQHYDFRRPRTFISSGGLGTMGFGMGAAIGACMATGKRTVLFTGDGSFGMNLNEMATAVSQNLPLVIMVMNNGVLGMVRQWQTLFYEKRYSQTTLERKTDFVALAEAFGATGLRAATPEELDACVEKAFAIDGPVLIDCLINEDERVLPMIPPNSSVEHLIMK